MAVHRLRQLLPVGYAHLIFTLPHAPAHLALQNKRVVYDVLFQASAATLLEVVGLWKYLGAMSDAEAGWRTFSESKAGRRRLEICPVRD